MAECTDFNAFRKPDGTHDWSAYRKAQVANGEICSQCGKIIPFIGGSSGHPKTCSECKGMEAQSGEEVSHHSYVRCPKCGFLMEASELEVYEDGDHEVSCWKCDHDFTITTSVSFSFTSPPREGASKEAEG